ncbi:multiubiquitin domain-containing protein [Agromyces humi]|uniref:multiubiquitin domain-containing protein n=1 Tax=Agromyces humi TaxID=1766800 RepID=UPI001358A266|nr:multiubiquitin domain-containing protein [Agromyces humi]
MPKQDNVIHIDKNVYKVEEEELTGSGLRALPEPDIASNYELVLQVPGGDDRQIADDEIVVLENGMHFFSVPKNLDAGGR